MPKGGPLSFLNKKPWHPTRVQNLEEKWKREQAAASEKKKLEELRAQYEEERKNQEFLELARQHGQGAGERLDWMYAGSLAAKEDAAKRQEEALLGQRAAQIGTAEAEQPSRLELASGLATVAPSVGAASQVSQNEQWARLNNDPLLMIKRQQQDQLKKLRDNPIKMQDILRQVQQARGGGGGGGGGGSGSGGQQAGASLGGLPSEARHEHGRKDKKHKDHDHVKHKHKHKKEKESSRRHHGGDGSDSDRGRGGGHQRRSRSRSRSRSPRREGHHREARNGHSPRRGRSPPPPAAAERYGDRERERETARYGDRESKREMDSRRQRDSHADRHRDTRSRDWAEDTDRGRDKYHQSQPAAQTNGGGDGGRDGSGGLKPGYGLSHNSQAPTQLLQAANAAGAARAAETMERLRQATARKAEEERAKAAARGAGRTQHRTGQLSEEERARRLAEMSSNAQEHDAARLQRLKQAAVRAEAADGGAGLANSGGVAGTAREGDAFLAAASRDVYGALQGASLESRVNSRKHFTQR